ncbi:MAG TPA: hypothetical protein VEW28_09015 [Candidatus Kapabacteria bacterium]|nr:hypothetical protein [Candidatus Kapabacteria bacterium]
MKRIMNLKLIAITVVVVMALGGVAFAQPGPVPSLVTQQMRLSSGGATPNYVHLRGITGAAAATDPSQFYQLDQAPIAVTGTNYSLWLNDKNQIVRSNPFGLAQANFLLQVTPTGNGLQWVDPSLLTTLNGDIKGPVDSTLVNVGHSGLDNRLIQGINDATGYDGTSLIAIDRGGTNSNAIPVAGTVAYGDGTKYMFTAVGTTGQVLISQGAGAPIWSSVGALFVANNGLTQTDSLIQWGGPLLKNTNINQSGFDVTFTGAGNFKVGDGTSINNITLDPGAGGFLALMHLTNNTDTSLVTVDASGHVHTRSLTSLVNADNGLSMKADGTTVELGGTLIKATTVGLATNSLSLTGAGSINIGDGTAIQTDKIDVGAGGTLTVNHLTSSSDTTLMILDPNGVVHTRGLGTLVGADNGLFLNNVAGTPTVELGSTGTGGANLLTNRFVTLNGKDLNFDGAGNLNLGTGTSVLNTTIDPGVTGKITLKNLTNNTDTTFLTVDNLGVVHTRSLTAIVGADNGLSMKADGTTVELGGTLIKNTNVALATNSLSLTGAGSINIGDGTAVQTDKIDVGAGGTLTVKNLTGSTDTTLMILDPNGVVHTRGLGTLVGADNGLTATDVAGVETIELGAPATAGATLLTDRFVTMGTKALTFDGAGSFNIGAGSSILNTKIDVGAGGTLTLKNLTNGADSTFITVDNNGVVHTRSLTAIVGADNGLSMKSDGTTVELGGTLLKNTNIGLATFNLSTSGVGNINFGDGTSAEHITLDPSATSFITLKNIAASTDTTMLIVDGTGNVHTRSTSSLVGADNGLVVNNIAGVATVELGSAANTGAPLLVDRYVGLNGKTMNFMGAGNFNVGDGTSIEHITLDAGATGNLTINHLTTTNDTSILILDASNNVHVRALTSLVNADNGLTIANGNTVELGSAATNNAPLLSNRFVNFNSKTLNFENDGTFNVGTGGNMNLAVNTGSTGNMSITGATLNAATGMNNFLWADTSNGNVRRTKTNDIATNTTPAYYITIDNTGQVTKSIPNSTIFRGQIAGTGVYQYTSPNIANLVSGAAITLTVENHTGVTGAIVAQVTDVTPGTPGTFKVETSENIQSGSFINYVVMNP